MGYAEAIEQQAAAFKAYNTTLGRDNFHKLFARMQEALGGIREFDVFYESYLSSLMAAEPFYVTPPFVALLRHAAVHLPDATITPDLFPSQCGYVLFGSEVPYWTDIPEEEIAAVVARHPEIPAEFARHPRPLRAVMWSPYARRINMTSHVGMMAIAFGRDESPQAPCLTAGGMYALDYGDPVSQYQPDFWRVFLSLLLFMRQAILTTSSRPIQNRGARKRLEKDIPHLPEVRVVELRRRDYQQRDESQGTGVEYTCQWLVRGHWHQYHTREGLQPRWVMPYVKGPSDKPLRVAEKVAYEVVR